jgi:formiminoglutamase
VLAGIFEEEFPQENAVALNNPFSGGFIANAHFWHKGIPWIQIEINRALYEQVPSSSLPGQETEERALLLRETIWKVLTVFWDQVHN